MTYGQPPMDPPPRWQHGSPWTYPSSEHGPPPWPPTYWVPGPPPPPRSRWRAAAALAAIVIVLGGIGVGAGELLEHAINGHGLNATDTSSIDSAVVDVNTDLGGGNSAAGTGMVITSNGDILTNNHVVEGSLSVSVQFVQTGQTYNATVIGTDPTDDVAVVRVNNASGFATIPTDDSSKVSVGDSVTAVGNALGRGGTPAVTNGHVTALGQTVTATDENGSNPETLSNMIEFDAQIQPGDSGGPLLDGNGKVVGMDTAGGGRVNRPGLGSNVGFAIPINGAMTIAHDIVSGTGSPNITNARTPLLGVVARDSSNPSGALVVGTQPGSPAQAAGIRPNDVITSLGGTPVDSVDALHNALVQHRPGDTVTVQWVDSGGQSHSAQVQLAVGAVP